MESEKAKRIWDAQRLALPEGVHVATARQLARFAARIEQSVNNPTMSEEEIETLTQELEPIAQEWLVGKA